jgi:Fic family protein
MEKNNPLEREALKDAVQSAIASNSIEGIQLSPESLAILKRVADGEISTEEARQMMLQQIEVWKKEYPDCFWQGEIIADPNDPYVYAGTNILINKFGIIDPGFLMEVEGFFVTTRIIELRINSTKGV